ncbi:glycosyltransferase family 8 protein [Niabella hibiscisoli]|uniref:glycosyltransferase family 8 protein n=1 Tax=Niabella hibiscisoli TaxID=1825928 RepID=UPI0021D45F76|nr:glycosyltransferase [Niabella hibiscisoli]
MNSGEVISIVTVCDNQFAVLLAALLKSIEVNHVADTPIDLYIVNDGISQQNVDKLKNVIGSDKIKIIWKTLEEAIPRHLKLPMDNTSFPANTYARICIPHFIDPKATRAIYLDVDMILLKDVETLWQLSLDGFAVGAVRDRSQVVSSEWGELKITDSWGYRRKVGT